MAPSKLQSSPPVCLCHQLAV